MSKTVFVRADSCSELSEIVHCHPNASRFMLAAGTYLCSKPILIDRPDITFCGAGAVASMVKIVITSRTCDGIVVKADRCTVRNVSIGYSVEAAAPVVQEDGALAAVPVSGIALAIVAANNVTIEECHIHGHTDNYAVYFSGPQHEHADVVDLFHTDMGHSLNKQNRFTANLVYSTFHDNGVAFCLQRDGVVSENIVRGTELCMYVCRDCICSKNKVIDSVTYGIGCSWPCANVVVSHNVVKHCRSAGICVRPYVDSFDVAQQQAIFGNEQSDPANKLDVAHNNIYATLSDGIIIDDVFGLFSIDNNIVSRIADVAVHLVRVSGATVTNNTVTFASRGITADVDTTNAQISNNTVNSIYPHISSHAIIVETGATANTLDGNSVNGKYLGKEVLIVETESNEEHNTTFDADIDFYDDIGATENEA